MADDEPKPLAPDKIGTIDKVFRELVKEKDCWKFIATLPGAGDCQVWEATCDKSQVDVYTGNFVTPQIHVYKKGGKITICGTKVVLPETNRIT
jgi:hypothetical protein